MRWLRKLRGLLGFGVTWGAMWGVIGAGIGSVVSLLGPGATTLSNSVIVWAMGMGAYGVISGIAFGGLLALGEGSRTLRELSLKRVALWGVVGSGLVPLLFLGFFDAGTTFFDIAGAMLVTAGLGGTFAPGAVAMARRAELAGPDEQLLLD